MRFLSFSHLYNTDSESTVRHASVIISVVQIAIVQSQLNALKLDQCVIDLKNALDFLRDFVTIDSVNLYEAAAKDIYPSIELPGCGESIPRQQQPTSSGGSLDATESLQSLSRRSPVSTTTKFPGTRFRCYYKLITYYYKFIME